MSFNENKKKKARVELVVWSLGMIIKDDSLKERAYRFHIEKR